MSLEFPLTSAVFFPSITTAWAPSEFPVEPSIFIFPVEYIIGLPAPFVDKLQFLHYTTPSPLSVASVAHEPPTVLIVTSSPTIFPP